MSESSTAEPLTPVLNTGLVNVLFVKVCDPVKVVTTAVSIAIASADTEIPVPPIAFIVAAPDVYWLGRCWLLLVFFDWVLF